MNKFLKFLSITLCCVVSLCAVSCDDDEDEPGSTVTETDLIGKWSLVQVYDGESEFEYIEFLKNHIGAIHFTDEDDDPHEFTWTLNGDVITMEFFFTETGNVYSKLIASVKIEGDLATLDGTSTSYEGDGETWHDNFVVKKMK